MHWSGSRRTFASMAKLERFRGHFYNWYDTSDLRALEPKYISSVDSGNLAGHLIALGNACHEIAAGPIGNQNWVSGLEDTVALVRDSARLLTEERRAPSAAHARLNEAIDAFAATLRNAPSTPAEHRSTSVGYGADGRRARRPARAPGRWNATARPRRKSSSGRRPCVRSVLAHRQDIDLLMPWASLLTPEILAGDEIAALLDAMPTLGCAPGALRGGVAHAREPPARAAGK